MRLLCKAVSASSTSVFAKFKPSFFSLMTISKYNLFNHFFKIHSTLVRFVLNAISRRSLHLSKYEIQLIRFKMILTLA
ncbi:hypothetical protein PET01_09820 [Pediococcus ethanolidurans]|nr:hypothetical protein PET01_09820 [Pediococcus ethanolidurans]